MSFVQAFAFLAVPAVVAAYLSTRPSGVVHSSGAAQQEDGSSDEIMELSRGDLGRRDIYHIAFLLRQKLPAELVPQIVDYAECWLKSSRGREDQMFVTHDSLERHGLLDLGSLYLCSDAIGLDGLTGRHPVRKVVFTVRSKDQGFSWDDAWHGTYEHSWTWFEAVASQLASPRGKGVGGIKLISNVHAGREYKTHVVECSLDSDDQEVRKWVKDLERGQVIELRAWARFPGWMNNVSAASIDIYTAVVR